MFTAITLNIAGQTVINIMPRPQVKMFSNSFPDLKSKVLMGFVEEEEEVINPYDKKNTFNLPGT